MVLKLWEWKGDAKKKKPLGKTLREDSKAT